MSVVDADTHVDESEATWERLEGGRYARYIPATITVAPHEAERMGLRDVNSRSWLVEGRLQNRAIRDEVNHPPRVRRELEDVAAQIVAFARTDTITGQTIPVDAGVVFH